MARRTDAGRALTGMGSALLPKRVDAGTLAAAVGAALLLGSLFVDWYEPGVTAWTVFEVLDLLLAALSIGALAVLTARRRGAEIRNGYVAVIGAAAYVVVASQLVNRPPAATESALETGAWLGLGGAVLLLVGGILVAVARVSVALQVEPRRQDEAAATEGDETPSDRGDRQAVEEPAAVEEEEPAAAAEEEAEVAEGEEEAGPEVAAPIPAPVRETAADAPPSMAMLMTPSDGASPTTEPSRTPPAEAEPRISDESAAALPSEEKDDRDVEEPADPPLLPTTETGSAWDPEAHTRADTEPIPESEAGVEEDEAAPVAESKVIDWFREEPDADRETAAASTDGAPEGNEDAGTVSREDAGTASTEDAPEAEEDATISPGYDVQAAAAGPPVEIPEPGSPTESAEPGPPIETPRSVRDGLRAWESRLERTLEPVDEAAAGPSDGLGSEESSGAATDDRPSADEPAVEVASSAEPSGPPKPAASGASKRTTQTKRARGKPRTSEKAPRANGGGARASSRAKTKTTPARSPVKPAASKASASKTGPKTGKSAAAKSTPPAEKAKSAPARAKSTAAKPSGEKAKTAGPGRAARKPARAARAKARPAAKPRPAAKARPATKARAAAKGRRAPKGGGA